MSVVMLAGRYSVWVVLKDVNTLKERKSKRGKGYILV